MKKLYALVIIIALVALLFPKVAIYEDGGTKTYTSLAYKVIKWNTLDGKTGVEMHLFPNNFHSLDDYDN